MRKVFAKFQVDRYKMLRKLSSGQGRPSKKTHFWSCDLSDWLKCHRSTFRKKIPGLLHTPAKYEKNPPYGYEAIAKRKCGSGGVISPIHKQASLAGHLINLQVCMIQCNSFFRLISIDVLIYYIIILHAKNQDDNYNIPSIVLK